MEIGHNAITLVRSRKQNDGGSAFEDFSIIPFEPSLELTSPKFIEILKNSLKQFCGSARETEIWTAPRLDRTRIYHLRIPPVAHSRLPSAVFWALKREEPFKEEETVVDFEVDEEDLTAKEGNLRVTGILVPREDIESVQKAFSQAGYPLTGVTSSLFALRNIFRVHTGGNPSKTAVICHVALNTTIVSVLSDRRLVFTRSIPLGLHSLAEALAKRHSPAPTQLQAASLILGHSVPSLPEGDWSDGEVFRILRPAIERLVRQVERTLEYYQTTYDTAPVETVYLSGMLVDCGRLTDFIASQMGSRMHLLDPFQIQGAPPGHAPGEKSVRIALAPAYGLALSTATATPTPNLARTYKDRQVEHQAQRVSYAIFGLFVLLAATCGIFYAWQQTQLRELRAERDDLILAAEQAAPLLNETVLMATLEEVKAQQKSRKAAARRYESAALLSEIAGITPQHISLLHLTAEVGAPVRLNRPDTDPRFRLEGVVDGERASLETALTIYVARLDQSPLVREIEVEETELVESRDGLHLAFVLSMDTSDEPESESE